MPGSSMRNIGGLRFLGQKKFFLENGTFSWKDVNSETTLQWQASEEPDQHISLDRKLVWKVPMIWKERPKPILSQSGPFTVLTIKICAALERETVQEIVFTQSTARSPSRRSSDSRSPPPPPRLSDDEDKHEDDDE
eukprot:NODE_6490_length_625_cov_4.253472_g5534_i0.p1 GENE.NODE_6490_length_625_cov_4.253472_g5534_i0~~NODE_6490_length_625_cov_4.253472_g5534_i0.p1  ORF type:complete len:136 (+),score=21.94 NODE_6490_length_625_cov_4.253472_g5534_i0:101-508(+)